MGNTFIVGALAFALIISVAIMAILLYNFMQLLSTLNKRLIAVISDILQNIDLSTNNIDKLVDNNQEIHLEDVLNEDDNDSAGFNPHGYDPFKEDSE